MATRTREIMRVTVYEPCFPDGTIPDQAPEGWMAHRCTCCDAANFRRADGKPWVAGKPDRIEAITSITIGRDGGSYTHGLCARHRAALRELLA
jgi:hypothetical protein